MKHLSLSLPIIALVFFVSAKGMECQQCAVLKAEIAQLKAELKQAHENSRKICERWEADVRLRRESDRERVEFERARRMGLGIGIKESGEHGLDCVCCCCTE